MSAAKRWPLIQARVPRLKSRDVSESTDPEVVKRKEKLEADLEIAKERMKRREIRLAKEKRDAANMAWRKRMEEIEADERKKEEQRELKEAGEYFM